ncbi:MAG: hypothetical protein J6O40_02760 [Ruminococcus sp.]|nr:hypothetical protein [Ruminococcus sp.]
MRKNNAVNSYISGVKKLSARENPFADDVTDDSPINSKREITHKAAYVRPQLGVFAAAAVLIVFVSFGAVILGNRIGKDSPATDSFESTAPSSEENYFPYDDTNSNETPAVNKFTDAKDAINAYRETDRQAQEILCDFDRQIETAQDIDMLRNDVLTKLMPLANTSNSAVEYLKSVDVSVLLLDVYRHEGDEAYYLEIFNGLNQKITLSEEAEVNNNITGEKYTNARLDEPTAIESKSITEIRLLPDKPLVGELNVKFAADDGDGVIFDFDFSETVTTLSRERIAELTKMLGKE